MWSLYRFRKGAATSDTEYTVDRRDRGLSNTMESSSHYTEALDSPPEPSVSSQNRESDSINRTPQLTQPITLPKTLHLSRHSSTVSHIEGAKGGHDRGLSNSTESSSHHHAEPEPLASSQDYVGITTDSFNDARSTLSSIHLPYPCPHDEHLQKAVNVELRRHDGDEELARKLLGKAMLSPALRPAVPESHSSGRVSLEVLQDLSEPGSELSGIPQMNVEEDEEDEEEEEEEEAQSNLSSPPRPFPPLDTSDWRRAYESTDHDLDHLTVFTPLSPSFYSPASPSVCQRSVEVFLGLSPATVTVERASTDGEATGKKDDHPYAQQVDEAVAEGVWTARRALFPTCNATTPAPHSTNSTSDPVPGGERGLTRPGIPAPLADPHSGPPQPGPRPQTPDSDADSDSDDPDEVCEGLAVVERPPGLREIVHQGGQHEDEWCHFCATVPITMENGV